MSDELTVPPDAPTLPLTPEVRKAYVDLYNSLETAIQGTTNVALLLALNPAQTQVSNVLTKDNMYKLHANTALFQALLEQIEDTNEDLEKLQDQIASIAAGFDMAGKVLSAINKVLTLVPGL